MVGNKLPFANSNGRGFSFMFRNSFYVRIYSGNSFNNLVVSNSKRITFTWLRQIDSNLPTDSKISEMENHLHFRSESASLREYVNVGLADLGRVVFSPTDVTLLPGLVLKRGKRRRAHFKCSFPPSFHELQTRTGGAEEEGGGKWNPIRRRIQQHGLPPLPGSSSLLLLLLFLHSKKTNFIRFACSSLSFLV